MKLDQELESYFFEKTRPEFQQILIVLHEVILAQSDDFTVGLKWQMPAYDYKGLCIGVGSFKTKVSLFFHRGKEMNDPLNWFVGQEDNKTMRTISYTHLDEIDPENLELYIQEAMRVNQNPIQKTLQKKPPRPLPPIPSELNLLLEKNPEAYSYYHSLSKSHQREYLEWILQAKRPETRQNRIAKTIEKLNLGTTCWDKYKK